MLKVLWWQAPTLLNPHFASGTKDQIASRIFFEPLAGWDKEGNLIPQLAAVYREVHGDTRGLATGLGSDINGIHEQAAPREDAATNPLVYPFTSYDGRVRFERQRTGERVFDLNTDGVAHYGLYPDFIADMQRSPGGEEALTYLFRSAEAYLQFWERSVAAGERARDSE